MSVQPSGSAESKKRNKKSKDNDAGDTLTKEEQQIARYLRLNCPNKQGNLHGMKVDFFIGNKLIDCLMESKWGVGKEGRPNKQPLLANRQACINFMQRLMNKQLFHRAIKVYKDQVDKSENPESTPSVRKRKANSDESKSTPAASAKDNSQKRKFKLEILEDLRFVDSNEPYVWVYDPTSTKTYIIGSLLILGAIGICLFPLWPSQVREGVYYVSLAGASFLGGILGLAVFKYILFALIWVCTFGSVHFWLFPNLTEDVGFFESFVPVYKCNNTSSSSNDKKSSPDDETSTTDNPKQAEDVTVKQDDMTASTAAAVTSKTENKSVPSTPNLKTATKELSKSTLEINSVSDSPNVRRKASSREDDGFELVDGEEELVKS